MSAPVGCCQPGHNSSASADAVLQWGQCCSECSCFCSLPSQGPCSSTFAWDPGNSDYLCNSCIVRSTAPWAATPHIATGLGQCLARPMNIENCTVPSLHCGQNRSYSHPCSTCSSNNCRHRWRNQTASSAARTCCCHAATMTSSTAGPQVRQMPELREEMSQLRGPLLEAFVECVSV